MAGQAGAGAYQWDRLPDMPTARCYTVGAYHKEKLYAIGEDSFKLIPPVLTLLMIY